MLRNHIGFLCVSSHLPRLDRDAGVKKTLGQVFFTVLCKK